MKDFNPSRVAPLILMIILSVLVQLTASLVVRTQCMYHDAISNQPLTQYYDESSRTWDECKYIVEMKQSGVFFRTPTEVVRYRAFIEHVKKKYKTMDKYIAETIFAPIRSTLQTPKFVIRSNDFPYNLDPAVEHWLLWGTRPLALPEITILVNSWLSDIETTGRVETMYYPDESLLLSNTSSHTTAYVPEWTYWVNPPGVGTVPAVWHAHIFVNRSYPVKYPYVCAG